MAMAKKNDWVMIRKTVLEAGARADAVPDDTKAVPLVMWVKGHLLNDAAEIGDQVEIKTRTGRKETGELEQVNPMYELNYGDFVPEIIRIGDDARNILFGEDA